MTEHHYLPLHWYVPVALWQWGENKNNTSLETALTSGALTFAVQSIWQMMLTRRATVGLSCDFMGHWRSLPWRLTCVLLFFPKDIHQGAIPIAWKQAYLWKEFYSFPLLVLLIFINVGRLISALSTHATLEPYGWQAHHIHYPLFYGWLVCFYKFQVPFSAPASTLTLQGSLTCTEINRHTYQEWLYKSAL